MTPRIVIIGGVAGGMSAAARARRVNERASIIVLERGGFVSFANCGMPYHIAGRIVSEEKLLISTPQRMRERFNIDVRLRHEATRIDRAHHAVHGVDHATGQPFEFAYDKLILAPGAEPVVPEIEHARASNVFVLRSMEDTKGLYRFLHDASPKRAAIVGAGFIGLEMAEALRERGLSVTVIEKAPHALPGLDADVAAWVHKELTAHGVTLIVGTGLGSLAATAQRVTHVRTEDGRSVETDLVLLSIGVRPCAKLAQEAGLTIGASGGIAVDQYQRTSDRDIYAVGDAAEAVHAVTGRATRIPLAGPANRQGRAAGEHAAIGMAAPAGKVLGTAIVRVFGLSVGITGLSERSAKAAGYNPDSAIVHAAHHATYYPGAQPLHLKIIYDRSSGKVLGAQAAGGEGVDKRLDVIATAIHFGAAVDDLTTLDLAYAPQFGSAKDPVHLAAFVAQNQLRGLTPAIAADQVTDQFILDVRTPQEVAAGTLAGAVNIPVDGLRTRLGELDPQRPTVVMCQVGLRGHIATRILLQHGFRDVRNLKGGYVSASMCPSIKVNARPA